MCSSFSPNIDERVENLRKLGLVINSEVERNKKSAFVKNFKCNYETGKIPMYALIELFGFGTLSKFYENMKQEDKKEIAQIYGVKYTYLFSFMLPQFNIPFSNHLHIVLKRYIIIMIHN